MLEPIPSKPIIIHIALIDHEVQMFIICETWYYFASKIIIHQTMLKKKNTQSLDKTKGKWGFKKKLYRHVFH